MTNTVYLLYIGVDRKKGHHLYGIPLGGYSVLEYIRIRKLMSVLYVTNIGYFFTVSITLSKRRLM